MQIELPNYLPTEFDLEIFQNQDQLLKLVNEELSNELWRPFIERVLLEMKIDLQDWTMWEGFFRQENEEYETEIIVGALHRKGIIYTRGMRVKHVPNSLKNKIQDALKIMIQDYMSALNEQLENKQMSEITFTSFGDGKSKKYLCSICKKFYPASQFGQGYGNNPKPVIDDFKARCCDKCNATVVLQARMRRMAKGLPAYEGGLNEESIQGIVEAIEKGEPVSGVNTPPLPGEIEIPLDQIRTVEDEPEEEK
jgi:hypothetical protein